MKAVATLNRPKILTSKLELAEYRDKARRKKHIQETVDSVRKTSALKSHTRNSENSQLALCVLLIGLASEYERIWLDLNESER